MWSELLILHGGLDLSCAGIPILGSLVLSRVFKMLQDYAGRNYYYFPMECQRDRQTKLTTITGIHVHEIVLWVRFVVILATLSNWFGICLIDFNFWKFHPIRNIETHALYLCFQEEIYNVEHWVAVSFNWCCASWSWVRIWFQCHCFC